VLSKLCINEAWIVSAMARRVYLICAVGSLYFLGLYMGVSSAVRAAGTNSLSGSPRLAMVLRLSFLPGIAATATLFVAMWYFWFRFDRSHWAKKALWFLPLFFPATGSVLYYFIVYRRSDFSQFDSQETR
jgi:hypothetical protein